VSGIPASGKTAVGRLVSEKLGMPFLDKDDFLEAEFEGHPSVDPKLRAELSRKSDSLFTQRARELSCAVLVSFWRPIDHAVSYGTSTKWIDELEAKVVELHCRCRPDIALNRFVKRGRHAGHNDSARFDSIGQQMDELAAIGPIGAWPCFAINTDDLTYIEELATEASAGLQELLTANE